MAVTEWLIAHRGTIDSCVFLLSTMLADERISEPRWPPLRRQVDARREWRQLLVLVTTCPLAKNNALPGGLRRSVRSRQSKGLESSMKRSAAIVGAIASSMLAGAVPARSDIAGAPQLEVAAAGLGPISPAAKDHILDLRGPRMAQGAFGQAQPPPPPPHEHFDEYQYRETPHLELKPIKKNRDIPKKKSAISPTTDVTAAYFAFQKTKLV